MLRMIRIKLMFKACYGTLQQTRLQSDQSYTNKLSFINEKDCRSIPIYRILNNTSNLELSNMQEIKMNMDILIQIYQNMISLKIMDLALYESQRQGRISFYMTNFGEEAVQIGSVAALISDDIVYSQYRESGILLWRGFSFSDFVNQCYGNYKDQNKGRQMPVHYGCRKLNFVTISSPLATQLPQAVGAAYALKYRNVEACITCFFGEGAASEGDTHAAFNFSAVLTCPVLFICRNNGYAISTPIHQQYKGDGIAAKGPGYGIKTLRVDGNDAVAMYHATKFARAYVVRNKSPVLIEAMTYRLGDHSTSDDSAVYRSNQGVHIQVNTNPIIRLKTFLENNGVWNQEKEEDFINITKKKIISAINTAEKQKKPFWGSMFLDVYYKTPNHIKKQTKAMEQHLSKHAKYNK